MCRVGFYVGTGAVLVEILLILLAALASVHALQARDLYEAWGGRDLPGIVEWTGNLWPLTLLPPAVLLAVAGIFAWVRRWKRLSWVEYALPLWGRIRKASDLTTFCSVVALAIGARRPILEALEAARDAIGNPRFKGAVADLLRRVGEGEATATAFHHETFFPRMLSWSCHLGETRGDLGGVFAELSRTYSSQMERGFGMLTDLLTPVSLILVGNLVLISALITLGPYFGMFLISSTLGNY
jgi:type II secretory pathway component PulF